MEEELEIKDKEEFYRQRIDNMKKGNYIETRIVISKDENEPVSSNIDIHGVSEEQVAEMILCLDELKKRLEKQYPMASAMSKFMEIGASFEG